MRVPSPTSRSGVTFLLLWDVSWALVTPILALYVRDVDVLFRSEGSTVATYWLISAGISLVAFFAFRIQDNTTRYFSVHDALDVCEAVLFAELMAVLILFTLTRFDGIPRSTPLIHGALLVIGLIAVRLFTRFMHSEDGDSVDYHGNRERTIVIGANRLASSFINMLDAYAPYQQRVFAVLDENAALTGRALAGVRILGTPQELDAIVGEFQIHGICTDRVVIAGESDFLSPAVLHEVQRICANRQIGVSFLPRMMGLTQANPTIVTAAPAPLREAPFPLPFFFKLKRLIDIFGSLSLIILFLPILIIASLLVLLDVGRPLLFWQERVGRKGRPFLIYKFRTLKPPFDSAGNPLPDHRRSSAIGRLLRATRIDELPQLLNVLFGDMSLIGPRPLLPEDQPANVNVRLLVRPGISGWAQVNGAKLVGKEEKGQLDEWYIRNASLWLDLRISILTLGLLMRSSGSSAEALVDAEQVQSKGLKSVSGALQSLNTGTTTPKQALPKRVASG